MRYIRSCFRMTQVKNQNKSPMITEIQILIIMWAYLFTNKLTKPMMIFDWWPNMIRAVIMGFPKDKAKQPTDWQQKLFMPAYACSTCHGGFISLLYFLATNPIHLDAVYPVNLGEFVIPVLFTLFIIEKIDMRWL